MQWNGAVAVVTGGSRGIGREVAKQAAQKGATVGLIARNKGDLDAVLAEIGGRGAVATADVEDRSAAEGALAQLAAELGPVDILVNNAGIGSYGRVSDLPVEEFERVMRVNYFSAVYCTKAVLPSMLERRHGHIVNVASIAGRIGPPMEAAYAASKFAMVGFTEALAFEVRPAGIGVSMVNPGPVKTDFFDTRGHAYEGSYPKPVSAKRVADSVIEVVESDGLERVIPRALRPAVVFRHMAPPIYRRGTARVMAKQINK
ncbi:MAG TPA: SDR family NAD(P)-dependent oxidoreductase [Acidimicrobiales bacterium]|jgi:short-subunit dehydrogenase|nr:SDR family NAD(P)-dependent oxidoreductase [Acidimicrobiales bacterium]